MLQKFERTAYFIQHLAIRDEETGNVERLETRDEHPFWTRRAGWTPAKDLLIGDVVQNPDGTLAVIAENFETFHPEGVSLQRRGAWASALLAFGGWIGGRAAVGGAAG